MTTTTSSRMEKLAADLRRISDAYSGTCTWAVTDPTTGDHIGHREHEVMPTASLIKAPVLVTLYQAVHERKLGLDDRVRYDEKHRVLGSGVLSRMSFGVEMTARDAATLMMIISDNSATNMCIDMVGLGRKRPDGPLRAQKHKAFRAARRSLGRAGRAQDERLFGGRYLRAVRDDRPA